MNLKTKSILFLLALLTLFSLESGFALASFGISPPSVVNKDLVPGSSFSQDVYLLQGASDTDLNVSVSVDAGLIGSWIKIENGTSFVIPRGTQKFPMKVSINVPSDAKFGEYKGIINIKTTPAGAQKDGVSINLGADLIVDIKVSSIKVSNFSIQNFDISDSAFGALLNFVMKVKNEGNVNNGPTKVTLSFFDQYHSQLLEEKELLITEKVKSFETKDISANFPNNFEAGSYWADVKIYSDDKVVVDSKLTFNITSGQPSSSNNVGEKAQSSNLTWMYSLIALILVLVVWFFAKRKAS